MERTFATPEPVELYVELGKGDLEVTTDSVEESRVHISGHHADEAVVELDGRQLRVLAPRQRAGFFGGGEQSLDVVVFIPHGSALVTRTGSADQVARGTYSSARVKSGSGDVRLDRITGHAVIDTGSGDIAVDEVGGELRTKSGSGDVAITRVAGNAGVSTGSGTVQLGTTNGSVVLKSGSGDLSVQQAHGDLSLSSASGDLIVATQHRGALSAKNVSGDVRVGIPAGIPVWTDVSTVTGRIGSDLEGAGQPGPGEDHVEIRATSVSGDITLRQV